MAVVDRFRCVWPGGADAKAPSRRTGHVPLRGRVGAPGAPTIVVLAYRGASSSEVDLPVARLADRMSATVVFVGPEVGTVHAVDPSRAIEVTCRPADALVADVLVVPGGLGWKQLIGDDELRSWLRRAANGARGILAMSTGSLLLASVGRLDGRAAIGHWLADADLAALSVVDALADHVRWSEWSPS